MSIAPVRLKRKWSPLHDGVLLPASMLATVLLLIVGAPSATNCDQQLSTICPKDLSQIYPCSCQNGTQALLIKCQKLNLASLSNSLKNLNSLQVELIEISDSSVSKLFGPLFNDSNQFKFHQSIKELDIRSSNLRIIDASSQIMSKELQTNLQYLQLDRNQLNQVPANEFLNNLTSLRLLNLSSNLITAIEVNAFSKLFNLTELDLSYNKINKLNGKGSFNSLYNLEYLNLNSNELTKLDKNLFAFGRKLKYLDLSNNKLTSLDRQDFAELTTLETLRISNNQLTTIPRSIFSRNAKLYNLDMSLNKLEDIDTYLFKSVRFLKDLNMSGNLIKEITKNTFSPTTRIKSIDLSGNLLSALNQETFKGLEWLERIDLSHNQIANISNDAFSKIFLVDIDLSYNKLQRIFYWSFREISNITKLNLSHNLLDDGISQIAFESADCTHLDLSYNSIQDISKIPISNLTGIRVLDLSHNQITEFNKKSFTQKFPLYELHTIDASYNNISQITGNVLEKLRSIRLLDLSHNSLRRLTSGGLGNSPTLLELNLSHNNLVEVAAGTLHGLVSMKNLNITHNRLKRMIPIPVALNSIHLENNEISHLSKSAFPSLNSLLELYLDHNRINLIEEGTFSTLLSLHTLSLSNNNLSLVPAAALKDLVSLQTLALDGNSLQKLNRKAFGTLPIVFHLKLDHNNISSIADNAFEGLLQLIDLNMSYNNLLEIPPEAFSGLVSLRSLDLSYNHLTRFENKTKSAMEDLLSLEVANFSNNKLSIITGKSFISSPYIPYKLRHLDLSNNLIGIIANNFANGLKKVEWLSLKNNIINEIYPSVLGNASHLRYLDLSSNKLRQLKDGFLDANQMVNLTTLLLANNKLTSIQPREFDRLRSLTELDLSNNRLETFHLEYIRWVKRGLVLDLKSNYLECTCELLPFIAWIDSIKSKTQSSGNSQQQAMLERLAIAQQYKRISQQQQLTPKLLSQYLNSSQLISNINCSKPDLMASKSIMQLIDFSSPSSPANDMNCDKMYLDEVDSMRRLKASIQFTGAEPYYYDGEQYLKIGWQLVEPLIDLHNFLIIKAKFKQPFDLSAHRTLKTMSLSINKGLGDYQLLEQTVDRLPYDQKTYLLRNLDSNSYYVICIAYENSGEINYNQMINNSSNNSTLQTSFANILADYTRFNCIDMNSLLRQDYSDKLVSGATQVTLQSALCLLPILYSLLLLYYIDK